MKRSLYLFHVATGPKRPRRMPFRVISRWHSHPAMVGAMLYGMVARLLLGTRVTHVAISDGHAVLDCTIHGDRWWAWHDWLDHRRNLVGCYEVIVSTTIPLERHDNKRSVLPRCVIVTTRIMRRCGVPVPWWIITPRQLARWLDAQRYRYTALDGTA